MSKLKPVKLHRIIDTATVWTDELWDDAFAYLASNVNAEDAQHMADFIYKHNADEKVGVEDLQREFRLYPPTLLLGAFDLVRWRKATWGQWTQDEVANSDLTEYDRFIPNWSSND